MISNKKFQEFKSEYEKEEARLQLKIDKLNLEIAQLKSLIPLKEQLKQTSYKRLFELATSVYGISEQNIAANCFNKADLIQEILDAEESLKKL